LREEEAVAAMRAGAGDFISKNNMSRLAPAVEREVREAETRRERRKAEAALRAELEHKLEFYRRTISAATGGKLVLADYAEIERIAGPPTIKWEISNAEDMEGIRTQTLELARKYGMDEKRIGKLVMSVGEAVTNAIKHAHSGIVSVHRLPGAVMVVVTDKGPGIPALLLPDVALRRGYSTAGTLGMGYKIMIAFADRVYLATEAEGTMVGIEMGFHSPEIRFPGAGVLCMVTVC